MQFWLIVSINVNDIKQHYSSEFFRSHYMRSDCLEYPGNLCLLVRVHMNSVSNTDYRVESNTNLVAEAILSSEWKLVNLWIWDTGELCLGFLFIYLFICSNGLLNICWSCVISGLLRFFRRKYPTQSTVGRGINVK